MTGFENQGVIITGGASGIGAATARKFIDKGAYVIVSDISSDGSAFTATLGDQAHYIHCDVANSDEVARLIAEGDAWLTAKGSRLDILFNNAGIGSFSETPDLPIEEWQRVMDIDLNSVFYGCRAAIPVMRKNGGGNIVNTASISGMFGDYGFGAYNAAKAAVINYTRSLAMDHGKDHIRVNALCPGVIQTGLTAGLEQAGGLMQHWESQIPLGRVGRADEMANVVLFLASSEASYITGAAIAADGGMTARTGQPNFVNWMDGQNA